MHLNEGFFNIPADDGSNVTTSVRMMMCMQIYLAGNRGSAWGDCDSVRVCFVEKMRGSSVPTFLFQRNQRKED